MLKQNQMLRIFEKKNKKTKNTFLKFHSKQIGILNKSVKQTIQQFTYKNSC